jgi:hypothetical protein
LISSFRSAKLKPARFKMQSACDDLPKGLIHVLGFFLRQAGTGGTKPQSPHPACYIPRPEIMEIAARCPGVFASLSSGIEVTARTVCPSDPL